VGVGTGCTGREKALSVLANRVIVTGSFCSACFFASANALQTWIAVASFSPILRNLISCIPVLGIEIPRTIL